MTSRTFAYTGGWQTFTVPANTTHLTVDLRGAGNGAQGGGRVTGTIAVTPGQVLYVVTGGQGKANSGGTGGAGGFGGGGAGGNGRSANGGTGGGGYSCIRLGSTTGKILCVAGGAGGRSGDAGVGGTGGAATGGTGGKGTAGSGTAVTQATGGSQTTPGHFGAYTGGSQNTAGTSASSTILGAAGHGGNPGSFNGPGGGGGGGGYLGGGGGGGGSTGWGAGGGGGGGSNFIGSLAGATTIAGLSTGNGELILTWSPGVTPGHPNVASITAPASETRLKANTVTITANLSASYTATLKMFIQLYYYPANGGPSVLYGNYRSSQTVNVTATSGPKACSITIPLVAGRRWASHVWTEDQTGKQAPNYATTTFYSNFPPDAPTLIAPADNSTFATVAPITFTWSHNDPDGEAQNGAEIRFLPAGSSAFQTFSVPAATAAYTTASQFFRANAFYQWQVRTRDPSGTFGVWSDPRSIYVEDAATPPLLVSPLNSTGVDVTQPVTLTWRFRDPILNNTQGKADLRIRVLGDTSDADWRVTLGSTLVPGASPSWVLPANFVQPGFTYEWQIRTYDVDSGGATASAWSDSGVFIGIETPGRDAGALIPQTAVIAGTLGCGMNRVFAVRQGGIGLVGELTGISQLSYGRTRDDISVCTITIQTQGNSNVCQLIRQLTSWRNELVVYRDDGNGNITRPWEGPITRIEKGTGYVTIEARDVMTYVYRRIMKHGYSDAYPRNQTVVFRSQRIIIDALSRGDPNVLRYLTAYQFPDDATESRVVPDYSTTAWEEVDDMAANAGLDYTVVGRRIILFDTHRSIGKLPTMRNGDFSSDPIITEYGMNLATEYGVSNGAGVFGFATKSDTPYGVPIELLVSSYGDTAAAATDTLTPAATQALQASLTSQAQRGISDRWPAPIVVRIPDNSNVMPTATVTLDMLVPGVWIPLQAEHECGGLSQWQKLDSVTVTQDSSGEKVAVVMSPAPNQGSDPDDTADTDPDGDT